MENNEDHQLTDKTNYILEQIRATGANRRRIGDEYSDETARLRVLAWEALAYGVSEARIARTAHLTVSTLRKWQGK